MAQNECRQHASELATLLARSAPDGVLVAVIDDQIMVPGQAEFHQPLVDAVTLRAGGSRDQRARGGMGQRHHRRRLLVHPRGPRPGARPKGQHPRDQSRRRSHITYPDRAALIALLEPTDPDAVARRAARLRPTPPLPPARAIRIAQAALDRVERTELPTSDGEIIDLAYALAHPCGRDAALVLTAEHPNRASELWLALTRALPAPLRANPAALLGAAAHLTGNGALAGIALDAALLADPAHTLAGLLRQALHAGLTPPPAPRRHPHIGS